MAASNYRMRKTNIMFKLWYVILYLNKQINCDNTSVHL